MLDTVQKADVYAFGVLLVEMFIGERAFKGMRHPQIIHNIAVLHKHPTLPDNAPKFLQVGISYYPYLLSQCLGPYVTLFATHDFNFMRWMILSVKGDGHLDTTRMWDILLEGS